jgi:hypothetical protein
VNGYDPEPLRLSRARHEQRIREADAERMARELRGTSPTHPWLRSTVELAVRAGHRLRGLASLPGHASRSGA